MPIHDWTRVDAGIFHDYHHAWVEELKRALNQILPSDYYALAEQIASGPPPDVLTLQWPDDLPETTPGDRSEGGVLTVAAAPPQVRHYTRAEEELLYALSASEIAIRHRSGHEVVAMIEIVSPGNKSSRHALNTFVQKAAAFLKGGIHLLIIDLFPPSSRDPNGIHKAIWDEFAEDEFRLPLDKPLTLASYVADALPEGYVEPVGVGDPLPDMPTFLMPGKYVPVPLEASYQRAWEAVPAYWRKAISGASKQAEE